MQVPTIDFRSPMAPQAFTQSLRQTGFAVLSYHPIDMQMVQDIYREWEAFFNSPGKFDYLFDRQLQDGYFPFLSENAKDSSHKDLKEFFHVYPWGRYPALLSSATKEIYRDLSALAEILLAWVEQHTPRDIAETFSMPLAQMIANSRMTLLRILHYPPLSGQEHSGSVRAAPHEDINLITLLPAATAPGLQVKDTRGNWHEVHCDPGTLVVNVGDMLQICSDGYYPSTTHRVMNPTGSAAKQARLSMPLFLHPREEVLLSPEKTARTYLDSRLQALGLL